MEHRGSILTAMTVTPDSRFVISAGADHMLCVWDLVNGDCVRKIAAEANCRALSTTADGRRLVSGADDGTIRLWDLGTGNLLGLIAFEDPVSTMALCPRGIVFGTACGDVGVLYCSGDSLTTTPLVTPTRLWRSDTGPHPLRRLFGRRHRNWDANLSVVCPWCGLLLKVDRDDLLTSAEERCPSSHCGEALLLTAFTCDLRTWDG